MISSSQASAAGDLALKAADQALKATVEPQKETKRKRSEKEDSVETVAKKVKREEISSQAKDLSEKCIVKGKCTCGMDDMPLIPAGAPELVPVLDGKPSFATSLEEAFKSHSVITILNTSYGTRVSLTKEQFLKMFPKATSSVEKEDKQKEEAQKKIETAADVHNVVSEN